MAFDTSMLEGIIFQRRIRTNSELVSRLSSLSHPNGMALWLGYRIPIKLFLP